MHILEVHYIAKYTDKVFVCKHF